MQMVKKKKKKSIVKDITNCKSKLTQQWVAWKKRTAYPLMAFFHFDGSMGCGDHLIRE